MIIKSCFSFLAAILLWQSVLLASTRDIVSETISTAIRWQSYWEGTDSLGPSYRPGQELETRVLQANAHLYAFLAPIYLQLDIATTPDGKVESIVLSRTGATTNAEAVAQFLEMRAAPYRGCIEAAGGARGAPKQRLPRGEKIPVARPCPQSEKVSDDESFPVVLPEPVPPEAILRRVLPLDNEKLQRVVRDYLESRRTCGKITTTIPFYSNTDPRVYVLLESTGNCPRGVATFSRASSGRWEFGRFIADVPKEEVSQIIKRIKSSAASTIQR